MSLKFALPLVFATACLPLASNVFATTYTEVGDAGDLPSTAQLIATPIGNSATSALLTTQINGSLTLTNGLSDSDMFQIVIAAPSTFTASNNFFVIGANEFDSTISLFNATSGVGIASNDDAAGGTGEQSTLTVSLAAGTYDLLISGSGRYATDATGTQIFANYTDGSTGANSTVGASSAAPIAGYTGYSSEGGAYQISVSAIPNAVPEPSSLVTFAAGIGGLTLLLRRRAS